MEFARRVGNTIHVMHAGKIVESGAPGAVFASPQQEVTRAFLAEAGGNHETDPDRTVIYRES
jgi:ABC-type methionine transport system ATPase subunit